MNQAFKNLNALGYTECFYQNGQLWGFHDGNVMPVPIPDDIVRSAEIGTTRQHLVARVQLWCDRRGIRTSRRRLSR